MAATALLTLGRLPKALELARALHAGGWRVIVAEPFANHVCRPSRSVAKCIRTPAPNDGLQTYLDALLDIIKLEAVSLVIPVSEEAVHVSHLHGLMPEKVRLLCETPQRMKQLHDKMGLPQLCHSLGLPAPRSFEADSDAAQAFAMDHDHVVKPRHSCSGIGVEIRAASPLTTAQKRPGWLVQEQLKGSHVSSFSFAEKGRELASVLYRGTVFAGSVAVCFERVEAPPQVSGWISDFLQRTSHDGFIAFDFIANEAGDYLAVECNPRITSGIHFLEPAMLARAISGPGSLETIPLRAGKRFQQAYSTLTEAYAAFLKPREFARRMRELATARDVVWSLSDPLPFLLMTPMSWEILRPAMFEGVTLGEAAMRDIGWFGEHAAMPARGAGVPTATAQAAE